MKIERVDDRTVKCFLSNEELEEYDIDYKDFVTQSDKARELLHEVLQQAQEQVGYTPPKFAFEMQIMVVPEQGMTLTLTEGDNPAVNPLQQLLMALQLLKAKWGRLEDWPGGPEGGAEEDEQPRVIGKQQVIFAFQSLHELMSYAGGLPSNLRVHSSLYKMNDIYFLYIEQGRASFARYSRCCLQATEFARYCGTEDSQLKELEEHGECLIAEKALRKLHG